MKHGHKLHGNEQLHLSQLRISNKIESMDVNTLVQRLCTTMQYTFNHAPTQTGSVACSMIHIHAQKYTSHEKAQGISSSLCQVLQQ
jgi:hypothetical protein